MAKKKHELGDDLGVYYEDEPWAAAYGHFDSLDAACWEIVEKAYRFWWEHALNEPENPPPEARAILIANMAGAVVLRHMWGKIRPCSEAEQEDTGNGWVLLERVAKPSKGQGWFPFTRVEVVEVHR